MSSPTFATKLSPQDELWNDRQGEDKIGRWWMDSRQQLIPGLWIGGSFSARDLDSLQKDKIKFILSILDNRLIPAPLRDAYQKQHIEHLTMLLEDDPYKGVLSLLRWTSATIYEELRRGNGILVNCDFGKSRSTAVMMAYLMRHQDMNYHKAYCEVQAIRTDPRGTTVHVSDEFHIALFIFERQVKMDAATDSNINFGSLVKKIWAAMEPGRSLAEKDLLSLENKLGEILQPYLDPNKHGVSQTTLERKIPEFIDMLAKTD
ncbi:dual specificity phosphatase 12 [Lecanora helva]